MTTQYCLGNFNLYYMTNYALELFSNYHTYVSKLEKAYVVLFVYLKFISLVSSCPNKDKLNLNFKLSKTYKCLCLFSFNQFKLFKITIFNGSIPFCRNQFTKDVYSFNLSLFNFNILGCIDISLLVVNWMDIRETIINFLFVFCFCYVESN